MASFMNAADVIAAAVEIERRGKNFYDALAESSTTEDSAKFFTAMASEEKKHEHIFQKMLDNVGGMNIPAGSDDEEYLAYMHLLLDSHMLFMDKQKEIAKISPVGAAMQLEKDTLLFFIALEDLVPESEKKNVRACADEERKHLRRLAQYQAERT